MLHAALNAFKRGCQCTGGFRKWDGHKMSTRREELDNPAETFKKLYQKVVDLGITGEQLASLDALQDLRVQRKSRWPKIFAIVAALGAVFLGMLCANWPVQRRTMLDWYFYVQDLEIDREQCIVELHDAVLDVIRPPVDCTMCENVTHVDRVSNLSQSLFESKFAYTGRPVVIVDGTKNWTATKAFSFDFFKNIYADDSPALLNQEGNCQFFPYKTSFQSLGEVFNMSKDRAEMTDGAEPWYIGWSNCDSSAANILRQHYHRPYFLPEVAESSKTDWIFMGSPGYGAHMHIDNVRNPSWQAQITSTKRWTLEPPPECYHTCKPRIQVTVNPGEIFVLDTNRWFHATTITGKEMSITIGSEFD